MPQRKALKIQLIVIRKDLSLSGFNFGESTNQCEYFEFNDELMVNQFIQD